MLYVLDANVVSKLLKQQPEVRAHFKSAIRRGDSVKLSAITYFEAKRGLMRPNFATTLRAFQALAADLGILPLSQATLEEAVTIYATLSAQGMLIEDADILIAATAIAHKGILVTHNQRHFRRIAGLALEDWQTTP